MALRLAICASALVRRRVVAGRRISRRRRPLSRLPEARRVPVFLACGRKSDRYPSAIVCDNLKLLHSAGMDLTLREYPGGDQISPSMLGDMDRWIMDIVTGASGRNDCAGEG